MRTVGMIAEFNPLHDGHAYALAQARAQADADVVVVVMAGNFVQRGEPAIVDKWARARAALAAGADLVVELPVTDAVQAAGPFAIGGVALLNALGVDALAFGTEAPALDYAQLAQKLASMPPSDDHFNDFTQTYATQLNRYYQETAGVSLTQPNLLLGVSYAQAVAASGGHLTLVPFGRRGAGHDAPQVLAHTEAPAASGSAIRAKLAAGASVADLVPPVMAHGLQTARHQSWDDFYPQLRYRLQTADLAQLQTIYTMSEGLEYRLTQQADAATDFDAFLAAVKSKRYTYARMRRLALYTLLNLTDVTMADAHAHRYVQVLGFTAAGRAYLHQVKKSLALPLITKVSLPMLAPGGLLYWQHRADRLITNLTHQAQNFGRRPLMPGAKEETNA
ncbi:nucleotidyltransferase [Lacticaseibacillus daqingensis]|uniref:nucleotidyltransferase n=1 Tax=Lacticaseibacillus daqingensis TaxID=2486014 RepID=UPI000F79165D|nr:nucleotidyltransferase [Lacticaseibacillus daqingensis]